jgi:hypothetical protein
MVVNLEEVKMRAPSKGAPDRIPSQQGRDSKPWGAFVVKTQAPTRLSIGCIFPPCLLRCPRFFLSSKLGTEAPRIYRLTAPLRRIKKRDRSAPFPNGAHDISTIERRRPTIKSREWAAARPKNRRADWACDAA